MTHKILKKHKIESEMKFNLTHRLQTGAKILSINETFGGHVFLCRLIIVKQLPAL